MKNLSLLVRACVLVLLTASMALVVQAQNREKHSISAKAGGVNSVVGRVTVKRARQSSQQDLTDKDDLASGDVVSTGIGSRVEVLLNPGSYLRVSDNSEFELADNSLEHLRVRLIKGSAIVEATGADNTELKIGVATAQSNFVIARRGVYRFNVTSGSTELLVQKGRILIAGQAGMIKDGNKVIFSNNSSLVAKLTKRDRDEFDTWSKGRAELLARANQKLSVATLNSYLSLWSFDWDSSFEAGYGLWTYSLFARSFTFFPYWSVRRWGSPYGVWYDTSGRLALAYGGFDPDCFYGSFDPIRCRGRANPPIIVSFPQRGYSGGFDGGSFGGSSGGSLGGPSGGSSVGTGSPGGAIGTTPAAPSSPPPSQAGPRDPDSGGRSINRIKDPIN